MQNVKGTNDYWGEEQALRQKVEAILKNMFGVYDYDAMETPILNEADLLTSKYAGGEEILKEMYRLNDQGSRNLGLRYDLTIPFAKVVASLPAVELPFKRYEIGKVFRDGPVKRGRLREFTQCDVDCVGIAGPEGEAELLQLATAVFAKLGIPIIIYWNNRKFLAEWLDKIGVPNDVQPTVMLTLDKVAKIGPAGVRAELKEKGLSEAVLSSMAAYLNEEKPTFEQIVAEVQLAQSSGAEEVRALQLLLDQTGLGAVCRFDPLLSRGLSFYTGTVYEIMDVTGVYSSSLGGGGRYDAIVGQLLGRDAVNLPAVGISFGLESIMEMLKSREQQRSLTQAIVVPLDKEAAAEAFVMTTELRTAGIRARLVSEKRKLKKILASASNQGIRFVILIGSDELAKSSVRLKDMFEQTENVMPMDQAIFCMEKIYPPVDFT
ncbi:histidine--tRNA ligase [Paenibacillus sp. SYP-B3998]|uniref:Histidine--tRNA ligase n=1 Tax=Paenibacillus sp. SYP-B3998 TaxID=2678564 RepID=A0A6G3ZWG9_9BACL|nr:histidine--tRNA ligase [Paenibacillus sp. SYP-B3998]NEW06566.1 histidine--tRNA ligase [Paenibacillus sp. SYP-B3998]